MRLDDDGEGVFFFAAEIAPGHCLYVEMRSEPIIGVSTGVLRRSPEYMRRMIQASYAGLRIHCDRHRLAGEVGGLVDDLDETDRATYEAEMVECWRHDDAVAEQDGPFHSIG